MKRITLNLYAAFLFLMIGCEKKTTPFSADPVNPPQGTVGIRVIDGGNPAPNIMIKGIDPSGSTFATLSDSTGIAIFDPVPFEAGDWTFLMPDQNSRCFGADSKSITLAMGSNPGSVTFQYGVNAIVSTGFPTSVSSFGLPISGNLTLYTQNDCGITWTINVSVSGSPLGAWAIGSSGGLTSGQTYSFNVTSGQSLPWTIATLRSGAISNSISLSSSYGSASGSGSINTYF